MMEILYFIGAAAIAGAAWSLVQFASKVSRKDQATRWEEFDPAKLGLTTLLNAIGGGAGIYIVPVLLGIDRSYHLAILCGVVGEEAIKLLQGAAERVLGRAKQSLQ